MKRLLPLLIVFVAGSAFAQALTVNPPLVSIKAKETTQLNLMSGTQPVVASEWTSPDDKIATVSSTGLVTGVDTGMVSITGTYNGMSAHSAVTVFGPTPVPTPNTSSMMAPKKP